MSTQQSVVVIGGGTMGSDVAAIFYAGGWNAQFKPNEKLTKDSYSWDTSDLPEGRYRIKVVASDELSNPPDRVTSDIRHGPSFSLHSA